MMDTKIDIAKDKDVKPITVFKSPRMPAFARLIQNKERIINLWSDRVITTGLAAGIIDTHILFPFMSDFFDDLVKHLLEVQSGHKFVMIEEARKEHLGEAGQIEQIIHEYYTLREVIFEVILEFGPLVEEEQEAIQNMIQYRVQRAASRFIKQSEKKHSEIDTRLRGLTENLRNLVKFRF